MDLHYKNRSEVAKERIREMLPDLDDEEQELVDSLPEEYVVEDVPYVQQKEKHWSGAAVVQMVSKFHGVEPDSQEEIVEEAGWDDWRTFDHSTFREKLIRYLARDGFLVSEYFPQGHVAPEMGNGVDTADFVKSNNEEFADIDHNYLKAMVLSRDAPVIVRRHFRKEDYPMPEEMIQRLDFSGHCVLVVGWDENGFIYNDPWNQEEWGGRRGGEYSHISYETIVLDSLDVNCTKDEYIAVDRLDAWFTPAPGGVQQNKEVPFELRLEWPGVTGIQHDWFGLEDIELEVTTESEFAFQNSRKTLTDETLLPGQTIEVPWTAETSGKVGSFPVECSVTGYLRQPEIPWESDSQELNAKIEETARTREVIYPMEMVKKFGIREEENMDELAKSAASSGAERKAAQDDD